MENDLFDNETDFALVQGHSGEEFLSPLKRSTRLRYNCVSVSSQRVVFGANTGGIYIFSLKDQKLLEIAFAEKETGSVSLVKISPHEKYVAFVCSGSVHVLDLKLDSRSKVETVRSSSDFAGCRITSLLWDQSSTKLYIGDDLGKVSMMPVYSNKAKNLFSLPLDVILKLDSTIVQLDKADEKILVSTMTRCYLCDTTKQQYAQIGKKLRDGSFGACFLRQGTLTPMVYCARPGSRIWEVDYEGSVLNTHQFKQLLAVPSSQILKPDQPYNVVLEPQPAQCVAFPKLLVVRNHFLLTWTTSTIYVLDPINVKVIVRTEEFNGIQDVCCMNQDIYIFLNTMELHCVTFTPVTALVPLYLKANNLQSAANVCIHHRNVFLSKHVRKKFGVTELTKIYDNLVSEKLEDLADKLHEIIEEVENKIDTESESESVGSGRSRSQSAISGGSVGSAISGNSSNLQSVVETENSTSNVENISSSHNAQNDIVVGPLEKQLTSTEQVSKDPSLSKSKSVDDTDNSAEGLEELAKQTITEQLEHEEDQLESMENETLLNENVLELNEVIQEQVEPHNDQSEQMENKTLQNKYLLEQNEAISIHTEFKNHQDKVVLAHNFQRTKGDGHSFKMTNGETDVNLNTTEDIVDDEHVINPSKEVQLDESIIATNNKGKDISVEDLNGLKFQHADDYKGEQTRWTESGTLQNGERITVELDEVDSSLLEKTTFIHEHIHRNDDQQRENEKDSYSIDGSFDNEALDKVTLTASGNFSDNILEDGDDVGYLPNMGLDARKLSLTSLSSFDSAEVSFDQPNIAEPTELIAIPVKRRSPKKHRRKSSALETGSSVKDIQTKRSHSLSASAGSPVTKDDVQIFESSGHSVKDGDSISLYSNDSGHVEDGLTSNSDNNRSLPKEKSIETVGIDSPMSNSGEYTLSGDFDKSEEYSHSWESRELLVRESTLSQSAEKAKQGQTTTSSPSSSKAALMQFKNRVQTKVSTKTKTLIKNIKDKNLLTKAKEFAENLSQGTEAYLHTGDFHVNDMPDLQMSEPEITHKSRESKKTSKSGSNQATKYITVDEPDHKQKSLVDLTELEAITVQTKSKLQEVDVIINMESVYKLLNTWMHTLNKTYQQFHMKKYGTFDTRGMEGGVSEGKLSNKMELNMMNGNECETTSNDMNEGKQVQDIVLTKPTNNINNRITDSSFVAKILEDKEFFYLHDPLHLSLDVFTDVCELAQACFDLGCYGNILSYIPGRTGETSGEVTLSPVKIENKEHVETTNVVNNIDKEQGSYPESQAAKISPESTDTIVSVIVDETLTVDCDKHENHPREDNCDTQIQTEVVEGLSEAVEHLSNNLKNVGDPSELKCSNEAQGISNDTDSENKLCKPLMEVVSDKDAIVNKSKETAVGRDSIDTESEKGFFVRCYFPYLSIVRLREVTLMEDCSYDIWSALVSCMEEKSRSDSERYGMDHRAVLGHLQEAQAHTDHGALLLGHISKLFRSGNSNIVSYCVRFYPHIRPVDVMYLCRSHNVAMETIFKQYMLWMTLDETSAMKKKVLADAGKHKEAVAVWLNLLLSEEMETSKFMHENGCPRCMSHKVERKKQALIEQFVGHITTLDIEDQILNMFQKHGFWLGVLRILKKSKRKRDHLRLILQLCDISLLNGQDKLGYTPESLEDWKEVLTLFNELSREARNQPAQNVSSDWSTLITWNNLAILLVKLFGLDKVGTLLEEHVPEGVLSVEFYQSCLLAGMVQRQQRSILHSMLEKVDTYLWSQRPVAVAPQVQYLAITEKRGQSSEHASQHNDKLQTMASQIKGDKQTDPYVEDSDCHWGIQTKINQICPCCYLALKETVSHEESGVLIFRCGHSYHKFCLPGRSCLQCDDTEDTSGLQTFYI